ncbi:hypothetical protein [Acetobacterium sp.]|uniref:hypothetical protein n=1 Tax=Acetobacterium sp. TaxID=1872094 RepID=UPI002F41A92B
MNNEIRPKNNNSNLIRIANVVATNIKALHFDPEHTSINLKISNGMNLSFNWKTGKLDFFSVA